MGLPGVNIRKLSSNAGTVPPSAVGVAAIIAPCSGGSSFANMATSWTSPALMQAAYGAGPLVEFGNYEMMEDELPVVLVKPTCATDGSCSAVTSVLGGSSTMVPSVASTGSFTIADDYNTVFNGSNGSTLASPLPQSIAGLVAGILVYVVAGGILGTPGIQYVYSLDGGNTSSPILNLGTALTIVPTEPGTGAACGVTITLGTSTEVVSTGDYFWFTTTGPRMTAANVLTALAALTITKQPFDLVLIHGETSAAIVGDVEAWVLAQNAVGRFPTVIVNTRFKIQTPGAVESETTFATAMSTLAPTLIGLDVCCGCDGGAVPSTISAVVKAFPTSLAILSACEANAIGVDPAEQDLGGVPLYDIDNAHLSPSFHDEAVTNTLDYPGSTLRLSTLRSWFNYDGAYVTNAYLLSQPGSDYVYIQNNRCMNAAATVAFKMLTALTSKGVPRTTTTPAFILPAQAIAWEQLINSAIGAVVKGQVSGWKFKISRNDPLTGNGPQTITATLSVASLAYVKNFAVTAQFVSTLS